MEIEEQETFPLKIVRPVPRSFSVDLSTRLSHVPLIIPGATIPTEDQSVRARGTLLSDTPSGQVLTATVAGVVSRVNKLVMIRPLRAKYIPETGDVVIGRVVELSGKRWRLDVNAARHAVLLLSAVNLPGGVQRRRTHEDELNMRALFTEGDLVSAEVQEQWDEGCVALHTRSLRYGKLGGGQFVTVQAELVKRAKKHFHELSCGVHAILGNNGYIFLSERLERASEGGGVDDPTVEVRKRVARVRNCVLALDSEFIAIGPDTIMAVYEASVERGVRLEDMTRADVARGICVMARGLREVA